MKNFGTRKVCISLKILELGDFVYSAKLVSTYYFFVALQHFQIIKLVTTYYFFVAVQHCAGQQKILHCTKSRTENVALQKMRG